MREKVALMLRELSVFKKMEKLVNTRLGRCYISNATINMAICLDLRLGGTV